MKPKYLVRPDDFHIFEIDENNDCYRSWTTRSVTDMNGVRSNAMAHFTFENLTTNYGFFPINENEIEYYSKKNDEYYKPKKMRNKLSNVPYDLVTINKPHFSLDDLSHMIFSKDLDEVSIKTILLNIIAHIKQK